MLTGSLFAGPKDEFGVPTDLGLSFSDTIDWDAASLHLKTMKMPVDDPIAVASDDAGNWYFKWQSETDFRRGGDDDPDQTHWRRTSKGFVAVSENAALYVRGSVSEVQIDPATGDPISG